MSYYFCLILNISPQKYEVEIMQLYRTKVKVVGEMNYVLIRLASNSKVHQVIDILVVDIPEFNGLILSRDWSEKIHGYLPLIGIIFDFPTMVSQIKLS